MSKTRRPALAVPPPARSAPVPALPSDELTYLAFELQLRNYEFPDEGIDTTVEEEMHWALSRFDGGGRARLRGFLEEIVRPDVSDVELTRLWDATESNVWFYGPVGLRRYLTALRDALVEDQGRPPPTPPRASRNHDGGRQKARPGSGVDGGVE